MKGRLKTVFGFQTTFFDFFSIYTYFFKTIDVIK